MQGNTFKGGVTHKDVIAYLVEKYMFHGLRTQRENLKTKHKLFHLHDNDTQGPIFPHALLPPTIDKDPIHHIVITVTQSLSARCLNYSEEKCREALKDIAVSLQFLHFLAKKLPFIERILMTIGRMAVTLHFQAMYY